MRRMLARIGFIGAIIVLVKLLIDAAWTGFDLFSLIPYVSESNYMRLVLQFACVSLLLLIFCSPFILFFFRRLAGTSRTYLLLALGMELCVLSYNSLIGKTQLFYFSRNVRSCKRCDFKLAGVDLKADRLTDELLVKKYGPGCAREISPGQIVDRSYDFPLRKTRLTFSRSSSLYYDGLSVISMVKADCLLKSASNELPIGSNEIRLGASSLQVQSVYGPPTEIIRDNSKTTLRYISYPTSGDSMTFDLQNGKVVEMNTWISNFTDSHR